MASRVPFAIGHDLIEPYYRATQAMLRLVLDPECQLRLPLSAGDCLVLDNHRMLHGDGPGRGPRQAVPPLRC